MKLTRSLWLVALGLFAACQQLAAQSYPAAAPPQTLPPPQGMLMAAAGQGAALPPPPSTPSGSRTMLQAGPQDVVATTMPAPCDGNGAVIGQCQDACRCAAWDFFGEFRLLRPRNAEIPYAVPFNGPVVPPGDATPIQVGPYGVVNMQYKPAFRVGMSYGVDDCPSIMAAYERFEGRTTDSTTIAAPFAVRSTVSHPSTWATTSDGLDANASFLLNYDLADADYRLKFLDNGFYSATFIGGGRFVSLRQDFQSQYAVNGVEDVHSHIRFEGGGLRLGLEFAGRNCRNGLFFYGRGTANFVAGEAHASYLQNQAFDTNVVSAYWRGGRLVSILDLELGAGWTGYKDRIQLTAGYLVSSWDNVVKMDRFIEGVQNNQLTGMDGNLTFDGLFARFEFKY